MKERIALPRLVKLQAEKPFRRQGPQNVNPTSANCMRQADPVKLDAAAFDLWGAAVSVFGSTWDG